MVVSIAYVIEITTFPLILGGLSAEFDLSERSAHLLVSSYKLALVASIIVAGWVGDRLSREGVFAAGTLIFALSSIAMLLVSDSGSLIQLRIAQGVGAGLFSPMIPALLASRRPSGALAALGHWGMITGAAAAVYPFIAAYLTQNFNWQSGWLIVPFCAVLALFGLPKVSDGETLTDEPVSKPANQRLGLKIWAILGYVFVNYGLTTWFIVALALVAGPTTYSLTIVGFILFVSWTVFSLTNYAIAKRGAALRSWLGLVIGISMNCLGVLGFVFFTDNIALLIASGALIGMRMGLNNAPTTHLAFELAPAHMHGRDSLDIIAARLGSAFSVLLISSTGHNAVWAALIAFLLSIIFTVYVCRRSPSAKGLPSPLAH